MTTTEFNRQRSRALRLARDGDEVVILPARGRRGSPLVLRQLSADQPDARLARDLATIDATFGAAPVAPPSREPDARAEHLSRMWHL